METLRSRQTASPASKAYHTRRRRALKRRKFYAPDWQDPACVWRVLAAMHFNDVVILLCRRDGAYAVFTDLLLEKSVPSDKFAGNIRDATALFNAALTREIQRAHGRADP